MQFIEDSQCRVTEPCMYVCLSSGLHWHLLWLATSRVQIRKHTQVSLWSWSSEQYMNTLHGYDFLVNQEIYAEILLLWKAERERRRIFLMNILIEIMLMSMNSMSYLLNDIDFWHNLFLLTHAISLETRVVFFMIYSLHLMFSISAGNRNCF